MLSGNQRRVSVRKLGIVLVCVLCGSVSTDYTDLFGRTKTTFRVISFYFDHGAPRRRRD